MWREKADEPYHPRRQLMVKGDDVYNMFLRLLTCNQQKAIVCTRSLEDYPTEKNEFNLEII